MPSVSDKTTTRLRLSPARRAKLKLGFEHGALSWVSTERTLMLTRRTATIRASKTSAQLIVPHNVVESYHGERQDEGNERAQPELNQAIRVSVLGCINN